jgi:trigger factor
MASTEPDVVESTQDKPELSLEVKVETVSACERHVVVSIPRSEVDRYRQDCFNEIVPKAELPGFRIGKAPRKLVESRFKQQVADQVKSSLVMDSLQKVTDGGHFSAIGEPDLDYDAVDLPDDGDFVYQFKIEVRPDFETPKWEGLSLEQPTCEITDRHVDEHLARTLSRFVQGEPIEGQCQSGDTVILNASFIHDGEVISSFEEEKVIVRPKLSFGDAFIDDFDKLISGKSEGDEFSTSVTISESASNEQLSGQSITANFQIVEICRIDLNDLSDSTLASLGFDSNHELREFVRNELTQQFKYHQHQSLRRQIVSQLTAGADWELPESLIKSQTNRELQRMVLELQRSGIAPDVIQKYINVSRMNARQSTISALREHFVLEKISEDLSLEPSPEDYDREIELIAEQSDSTARRVRARLEKSGQMDAIRNQIVERMVIERVVGAASIKNVPDDSFFSTASTSSDIDFLIAGESVDIPEAKYNNAPATLPGEAKLPERDDSSKS